VRERNGRTQFGHLHANGQPGRGGSGLGNYNTSVCLSSLFVSGQAPTAALLKARDYIASSQLTGDDTLAGGFGYDKASRRRYADLSNTAYALDALHRTAALEELRTDGKKVDVDWDKALAFVEHLMKTEGPDAGGAAYNDRTPQAGAVTNASGTVALRAYGSMTYAAVLSMCHANLDRGDPRVRQALAYCERHWSSRRAASGRSAATTGARNWRRRSCRSSAPTAAGRTRTTASGRPIPCSARRSRCSCWNSAADGGARWTRCSKVSFPSAKNAARATST